MTKKIRYFDYAATTPLSPQVFKLMKPYFTDNFGNPANLYALGRDAKNVIYDSLKKITEVLKCKMSEFVFTGSATESDNLAVQGVARANKEFGNKIIVSRVEHKGILSVCRALEKEGFKVVELPVDKNGLLNENQVKEILDDETILVSVTCTDSETGTIQPIPEIASVIKKFREEHKRSLPYFHTDASQAAAYYDIDVDKLCVDLMTLSAHKLYGPKGVGGLYVRSGVKISPIIFGGGQQRRLRSGTENVPAIVGFGEAVRLASDDRIKESKRLAELRDALHEGIMKSIPKVALNGHPTNRLPNFLNVSILDIEGEALLLHLDEKGIVINTGSACNSESLEPSYVLTALGRPSEFVHGSLRFTFGKRSTMSDVKYVIKELPPIVQELRKISPLNLALDHDALMAQPKAFVGGQTPHFLRKRNK